MNFSTAAYQSPTQTIENMQDYYTTILEYYDELFPVSEDIPNFFRRLQIELKKGMPGQAAALVRYLGIGCATGNLENKLAGSGFDITGIDKNASMIETAKRRMKRGFSTTRFFEMSTIDMRRFLKQGSFNVIACLDNTLPYLTDETLLRKFFHDAKELLAPGGRLVLQTLNYDAIPADKPSRLPDRSSVRVTLQRGYIPDAEGLLTLDSALELGNGKKILLQKTTKVVPLSSTRVEALAREAGFTSCSLFGSYSGDSWSKESPITIALLG